MSLHEAQRLIHLREQQSLQTVKQLHWTRRNGNQPHITNIKGKIIPRLVNASVPGRDTPREFLMPDQWIE